MNTMEEKRDEVIELLFTVKNERLMNYLLAFIKEAIKLWG